MKVELKEKIGICEQKEFLITDDKELTLEFVNKTGFSNIRLVVYLKNGVETSTLSLKGFDLVVPKKLVKAGILSGFVKIYKDKEIIKCDLEDITIKEVEKELYAVPQIEILKNEIAQFTANINSKIDKFNSDLELLTKLVYSICDIDFKGEKK